MTSTSYLSCSPEKTNNLGCLYSFRNRHRDICESGCRPVPWMLRLWTISGRHFDKAGEGRFGVRILNRSTVLSEDLFCIHGCGGIGERYLQIEMAMAFLMAEHTKSVTSFLFLWLVLHILVIDHFAAVKYLSVYFMLLKGPFPHFLMPSSDVI